MRLSAVAQSTYTVPVYGFLFLKLKVNFEYAYMNKFSGYAAAFFLLLVFYFFLVIICCDMMYVLSINTDILT